MSRWGFLLFGITAVSSVTAAPMLPGRHQSQKSPNRLQVSTLPLRLRIRNVDSRFQYSRDAVRRALVRAISLWESAAGSKLFVLSDHGLPVDLRFDHRQAKIDAMKISRARLDLERSQIVSIELDLLMDQELLKQRGTRFRSQQDDYSLRLESYNQQVNRWNSQGGAPDDVFSQLERTRRQLDFDQVMLEADYRILESRKSDLSIREFNYKQAILRLNSSVAKHNTLYGGRGVVTVGECVTVNGQPKSIAVFAFENESDLASVLAHELGHALGMKHVSGQRSVMSAVDSSSAKDRVLQLSDADRRALSLLLKRRK